MNDRHFSLRNSIRSLMGVLVLAAAGGCGSGSSEPGYDTPAGSAELPQATETNSFGETVCSERELGVDEDGRRVVEREVYNFGKMTEELAQYPDLAEATGFSAIEDCEGARKYGERYRAFSAEHPDFRGEPTKAEQFDELLRDPANIGAPDSRGAEVEKVFGGAIGDRPAVVQMSREIDFDKYSYCSATRIAKSLFITAAHCLPFPTTGDVQAYSVYMKRRKTNGTEGFLGGVNGRWISVYAIPHPKYTGLTSADYDIAVVWVMKDYHTLLNSDPQFSATTLLATRAPEVNDAQLIYGWGASSNTEPAINWRLRTPPPQGTLHGIDGRTGEAWNIQDTGPAMRMCTGDSGGAALRDGMLDGVTSLVLPLPSGGQICSDTDHYQFWSRIDTKILWIRESILKLQKGSVRDPYRCVFHPGDPNADMDYDHMASYLDCNVK